MPRVAVLRHTFGLPSEPFVLTQARAFSRWEPVLVARDEVPAEVAAGLPSRSLTSAAGPRAAALHTAGLASGPLTDVLRSLRVDAVLAHFGFEAACALPATRRTGVPLATVFHGVDATTSRTGLLRARHVSWATYARRTRALAHRGDLFLPVSDHLRRRVLDRGFPADRTVTHHLGVDVDALTAVPVTDPEPGTLVHVGRLVPKKGHATLFHALAGLPGVRLTCVGEGPLRADLTALAADLRLDVEFTGALDHAATVQRIARAAVLCLPSTTGPTGDEEGLGQVLLEAGALSRPVVATRHGGIPSAVVDGTTGLLVPDRDPAALGAALRRVLERPGFGADLGRAAAAHVRENFDVRTRTARLELLLDGLLADRAAGRTR